MGAKERVQDGIRFGVDTLLLGPKEARFGWALAARFPQIKIFYKEGREINRGWLVGLEPTNKFLIYVFRAIGEGGYCAGYSLGESMVTTDGKKVTPELCEELVEKGVPLVQSMDDLWKFKKEVIGDNDQR